MPQPSLPGWHGSRVRCLKHLREIKLEGPSMADPFTLGAVGAVVLTEGIKFLYGQAGEALKRWRERKAAGKNADCSSVWRPA